jgi:hypothetical protein
VIKDEPIRKFFKGHGVALGGQLRQPVTEAIPSQASAAIPLSGGYSTARVDGFNHREIVSFKSAYTLVSGHESHGKLETLVTTVVEDLNILGVITADRIVARLSGSIPIKEHANPIVTPSGSYFQNLRVAGEEVKCTFIGDCFDELVCDAKYLEAVKKRAEGQFPKDNPGAEKGFLPVSLCKGVKPCMDVPHLGRIFLSEFLVSRTSHQLTMLRVELGCPVYASVDAGSVEGEPYIMP